MWITQGQLRQFRNYAHLEIDFASHKNLFVGENAAGKTNILEAIYFLSHGKSHRARHERELIEWGKAFATVKFMVHAHGHGGIQTIEAQLTLSPENTFKTLFKWNGQPVKSRSQVVGKIPTISFFLSDLLMLRGSPEDRRTALDSSLVQYDPQHFHRIHAYNRVRQQKSQLLKQPYPSIDPELLESLNQQLVMTGSALMQARIHYLSQIETVAEIRYLELSQGHESLTFQYQPCFGPFERVPTVELIQQNLWEAVQKVKSEEFRRGQVLVGPHRDDIRFFLDGQDACLFGSQGQQRSIVLAFKLAEMKVLEQQLRDEVPILLLDDVMAELDPNRQSQLLTHLDPRMQVFLATTHLDSRLEWFLKEANETRIFVVSLGQVTQESLHLKGSSYAENT